MATRITARVYLVTWIGLLVLTAGSFATSLATFPVAIEASIALLIATAKAGWVALVFMHLMEGRFANRAPIVTAALFVLLLAGLMVTDVTARHTMPPRPIDPALAAQRSP